METVVEHGHSHGHGQPAITISTNLTTTPQYYDPAYFMLSEHSGILAAHILIMIIAWAFMLPVSVMLSIARSRHALPFQFTFVAVQAVGLLFGAAYSQRTPELYEGNAHHTFGIVLTAVVSIHAVLSFISVYGRKASASNVEPLSSMHDECVEELRSANLYRYSRDSGQGTEPNSPRTSSPMSPCSPDSGELPGRFLRRDTDRADDGEKGEKHGLLGSNSLEKVARKLPSAISDRVLRFVEVLCATINRLILMLGFVALATGFVTYFGFFRGHGIFSGLAHFVKGGIFVWYGILVLGRWAGSFADLGWSWNVKPGASSIGRRKANAPSAEFVESFLIFFYGSTNVFLEHLGNWGKEWSASDFEHISVTIMFFGGGLCGMLIESKRVRDVLNIGLTAPCTGGFATSSPAWQNPKTYSFSLNPLPGIIIMLLGLMMSSHHQNSMVSTMIHKQWGMLFVVAALARGVTYILTYLSPPTSHLPSRPPSELVAAFCFISGGLLFMGSAADIVAGIERFGLDAMFLFTVLMGISSFIMAWEVIVLAIKGWAVRKEQQVFH